MIGISTDIAFALLALAMAGCIFRIIRGPTLADRILALDTMTIVGIAIVATFALHVGLYLYVDIAVALALVGFLATAAFARYLLSRGET